MTGSPPPNPSRPAASAAITGPDTELLQEAATALAASRNPVLVIGPKVDAAGAGPAAVALAERLGAPVLSSPFSGRTSFPKNHPLFAGFLAAAPNAVTASLAPHDLLLVLGAPVFIFHVAGDYSLPPVIQMTADGEALAATPSDTGILGSLRLGLPALSALLPESRRPTPALRSCPPAAAEATPIPVEYLLQRLAAARPADSIIVEEAPHHRPAIQQHLPIPGWGGFFTMASGGLGYGLPVGVALARPGRRVIAVIGDGSMMYSVRALWTAVRESLPLTVIVLNNGGYGAMRSFSRVLGMEDAPGIDLLGLDFPSLAAGMGCPARQVIEPGDLAPALDMAFASPGPMLIDVALDQAIHTLYRKG
jgi:benzoylformate decarboxylase